MQTDDQRRRVMFERLRASGHESPAELIRIIGRLFAAYERDGSSPQRMGVYCEDLADVAMTQLDRACTELRRELKFLPSIAEIRERVSSWALDAGGLATSPEQAWDEVMRLIQREGTNRVPRVDTEHGPAVKFSDPVTAAIMTAQWWRSIGQAPIDTLMSERRAFIDSYKANAVRARRDLQCGRALAAPRVILELTGVADDCR